MAKKSTTSRNRTTAGKNTSAKKRSTTNKRSTTGGKKKASATNGSTTATKEHTYKAVRENPGKRGRGTGTWNGTTYSSMRAFFYDMFTAQCKAATNKRSKIKLLSDAEIAAVVVKVFGADRVAFVVNPLPRVQQWRKCFNEGGCDPTTSFAKKASWKAKSGTDVSKAYHAAKETK